MQLTLNLTGSTPAEIRQLIRALEAIATPLVAKAPELPPAEKPLQMFPTVSATPPMTPPPPLPPEVRDRLDELNEVNSIPPTEVERPLKRAAGRPPKTRWQPAVPRPEGGEYGKQVPTGGPEQVAQFEMAREQAKAAITQVMTALHIKGMPYEKFLAQLYHKYGDGKFTTVPVGNYEPMIAEASAGPKDCPLTQDDLDAAQSLIESERGGPT